MAYIVEKKTLKTLKSRRHRPKTKGKLNYTKAAVKTRVKKGGVILTSRALVKPGSSNLRPKLHVHRGDTVVVISGADKGKVAKVLEVYRASGKILVEGVNIRKKHQRPSAMNREGEIISAEKPIFASKVMIWDSSRNKPTRVASKTLNDGKKVRIAKLSGEQLD